MASDEEREPSDLQDDQVEEVADDVNTIKDITEVDCKHSLAAGFSRLFNDESTADVTLVVGFQRYSAHKIVLSASSEYFYHMFYGAEWKESSSNEIELHETPACQAVFDTFIQCFYTGVVNLSPDTAADLLTLADKYDAKVKKDCEKYMLVILNKGNIGLALTWLPICNQLKALEVLKRCLTTICFNLEMAAEMPKWMTLSLADILTILQHDEIVVPSEYNIYVAIQEWILNQEECTFQTIEELLSHVQFKCMKSYELVQVETSTFATTVASESTVITEHLYDAFKFLAMNAETKTPMETHANRTYTKDILQTITFKPNLTYLTTHFASVIPICCPEYRKAKLYPWSIFCQQADGGLMFTLRLKSGSREVTEEFVFSNSPRGRKPQIREKNVTYFISKEIPVPVLIEVKVFLQNEDGIVNVVSGKSGKTSMPMFPYGTDVVSLTVPAWAAKDTRRVLCDICN